MAFVYGLRADGDAEPFYIGSTKNPVERRFKQHLDDIRTGRNKNTHLVRRARKIGADRIVCDVIEECSNADRFEIEYATIRKALDRGVKLTNIIVAQRDFEIRRLTEEYDNYEILPRHIEAILNAVENGLRRDEDSLLNKMRELIESLAHDLIFNHTEETRGLVMEVMAANYDHEEAERQTTGIHQRISEVLERHKSSGEGRVFA
jgi:hypothetical protein